MIFLLLLAQIPSPEAEHAATLLAPSAVDFDRALAETTSAHDEAAAIGAALSRVQNALGQRWATTSTKTHAPIEEPLAELALEPVLLRDHRDAIQSLRAASERLERISEAPTVAPIVFGARSDRVKRLLAATRTLVRTHIEMAAWHGRFVAPRWLRLKSPPELRAGPGWPALAPLAADDQKPKVAVVGIGGGTICPDGVPANGTTVVLRNEAACYGGRDCTCIARPVFPGAVLGPR